MKLMRYSLLGACLFFVLAAVNIAVAGTTIPGVGTDYFVYDLGTYNPEAPQSYTAPLNNYYTPGRNFKAPIAHYELNPAEVNQQISNMRASGMDYIGINVWFSDLAPCETDGSCNDGYPADGVWGYLVDDSQYALRPQQNQNLINILQQVKVAGFRYVVIRFAYNGLGNWTGWNETEYQKAWNLIAKVHRTVDQELAGSPTSALFDLDVELTGAPGAEVKAYFQRLWSDYTYTFGTADTVGFSTIADNYHLTNGLPWYGSTKPPIYAFDIYGDVGQGLFSAWSALGSGEQNKPIIIMETYDNDPTTDQQLALMLAAHPNINVVAMLQWPNIRQPNCTGCDPNIRTSTVQALATTTQVSNYAGLITPFVTVDTDPAVMVFKDVNCASTTGPTCTVSATLNSPPSSPQPPPCGGGTGIICNAVPASTTPAVYQVYVRGSSGVPKLWGCNQRSSGGTASWIQRNMIYEFDYYVVNTCSDPLPSTAPFAKSILTVHQIY